MWGRYGRADGVEFVAKDFMDQHPLWKWMDGYLEDRPTQPGRSSTKGNSNRRFSTAPRSFHIDQR